MKIKELLRNFKEKIRQKKASNCKRTVKVYDVSARSFNKFVLSKKLGNAKITESLVKDYENYLRLVPQYMRTLCAV